MIDAWLAGCLGLIIALLGALLAARCFDRYECHEMPAWHGFVGLVVGIAGAVILILSICVMFGKGEEKTNVTITQVATPLVSVYSDQYIAGSGNSLDFVIVTNDVYRYYYEVDGGIRQGTVPADNTTIYYTDDAPYLAEVHKTVETHRELWIIKSSDWRWQYVYYELYVPEGSVATQFKFD